MPMKQSKKELTPMERLTQGYEKFIKGKETNNKGKELFDKAMKKATTKQRGHYPIKCVSKILGFSFFKAEPFFQI
jgi:hypothetical protein